jgi:hypothetical protein
VKVFHNPASLRHKAQNETKQSQQTQTMTFPAVQIDKLEVAIMDVLADRGSGGGEAIPFQQNSAVFFPYFCSMPCK